ncbi:MAG: flagellar biosynthesis anti-sigma factor FlgM [Desulfobulbaceae bacterium]|nr:flagellar biosynthesis anti-sigma factor FlgM [Desulfobulbaceae bacterium]
MTVEFFGVQGFGQVGGIGKSNRPGDVQKSGKTASKEEASFSSALQGANEMQATGQVENAERAARVQALKEQVANGSYEPDLHDVASSLLKFLVEEG